MTKIILPNFSQQTSEMPNPMTPQVFDIICSALKHDAERNKEGGDMMFRPKDRSWQQHFAEIYSLATGKSKYLGGHADKRNELIALTDAHIKP